MTAHDKVRELIRKVIYEWVKQNFGESEADDPSWDIDALADEISNAKLMNPIYHIIQHEYTKEDIWNAAESMDEVDKLTDEDVEYLAERFEDEHDMNFSDISQYENLIDNYLTYEKGEQC